MSIKTAVGDLRGQALRLAKLLVLGFWVCGGAVAGGIVPLSVRGVAETRQEEARKFVDGVQFWFSTAEIILGALLLAALLYLERERRKTLITIGALAVLAIVNQYIVAAWRDKYQPGDPLYQNFQLIYIALFLIGIVIALVLFSWMALREGAPAPPPAAPLGSGPVPRV